MNAPALDERQHIAAITSALTAQLGANRVYEYGQVPGQSGNSGTLPPIFALPQVERRFAEPDRSGRSGRSGWRVSVRFVGRSANEARWAGLQVAEALDGMNLTIDGYVSTPVTFESQAAVSPDEGRYSGSASYTYVL